MVNIYFRAVSSAGNFSMLSSIVFTNTILLCVTFCVEMYLVAVVAISWHQILGLRSKFQQSTLRNQHFAATGVV